MVQRENLQSIDTIKIKIEAASCTPVSADTAPPPAITKKEPDKDAADVDIDTPTRIVFYETKLENIIMFRFNNRVRLKSQPVPCVS